MPNKKRSEKSLAKQEWERARDRYKVEAEDIMFDRDFKAKPRYTIPFDIIVYVESSATTNEHLGKLIPALADQEYNFFGFDVEGTSNPKSTSKDDYFNTLQLHTEIEGRKFNYVFQLNRIGKSSVLPQQLETLLKLQNNVYIGKGVEDEVKRFLRKYGISSSKFFFIELLALIRFCDMFSREYDTEYAIWQAEEFAITSAYSNPTPHTDDANGKIFGID